MVKKVEKTPRSRNLNRRQKRQKAKNSVSKQIKLPGFLSLSWSSLCFLRKNWKLLSLVFLIYAFLDVVIASGYSSMRGTFSDYLTNLDNVGDNRHLGMALNGFGTLFGGAGHSEPGLILQILLAIVVSLAVIWILRQRQADKPTSLRDAFYLGTASFVRFVIILFWLLVCLLPMAVGASLLDAVVNSSAGSGVTALMAIVFAGFSIISLYLLLGSIFSLYIITLPNMMPWAAITSAREIVRFRRRKIFWRLLAMLASVVLVMAIFVVPLIIFWPGVIVPGVFLTLSLLALFYSHAYIYNLYRSLL